MSLRMPRRINVVSFMLFACSMTGFAFSALLLLLFFAQPGRISPALLWFFAVVAVVHALAAVAFHKWVSKKDASGRKA